MEFVCAVLVFAFVCFIPLFLGGGNVYCFEVSSTEIHLDTRITKCSQFTILHELCLVLRVI